MKKLLVFLLLLSFLFSFAACGAEQEYMPPVSETVAEETTAFPVTVTDQAGRTVEITKIPERIVSGYYISSSAFIALGLADKLVGIEAKADTRPIYARSAPELIGLPNVGTAKEFDLEGCIALDPDLVVLPLKLKDAAETMEKMGIPVLLVAPEGQEELEEMLALLGSATGTDDRAAELLSFLSDTRERLGEIGEDAPSVYLAGNSALLSTAGADMYQSDMIVLAGGRNAAEEIGDTYWAEISYEQLLSYDPDYILLASDASYSIEDVWNDPVLADCRAVKAGHVLAMPGDAEAWDSPVPGGVLGSVWLAAQIHPEKMTEEESTSIINAFYEKFYDFTYSE